MLNNTFIKICGIEPESIVDGPGFRYVLFVQGCSHKCKGCHNPESWDPNAGINMSIQEILDDISRYPNIKNITISGGEPFEQVSAVNELVKILKTKNKHIMIYTGYTFEELFATYNPEVYDIIRNTDILVDGKFELEKRDLTLTFKGSSNQRIIDVKKSMEKGKTILHDIDKQNQKGEHND